MQIYCDSNRWRAMSVVEVHKLLVNYSTQSHRGRQTDTDT